MAIPTVALNEATPAGGAYIRDGDNRIREYKLQVREILEVDHYFPSSGQNDACGRHKQMTLIEAADIGTGAEGIPILGAQTVSGKPELVYTDEDDNDVQLTDAGGLNLSLLPFKAGDWIISTVTTARTGWTNVSATYSNKFMRINATPLTTGGADTHTTPSHTLTIAEMPAHTHTVNTYTAGGGAGEKVYLTLTPSVLHQIADAAASTGGGGGHTHSAADNVPAYVQVVVFQKD